MIANRTPVSLILRLVGLPCLASASVASAAVIGDETFISCSEPGANFRISELNRSVSRYSSRYQEYRPVCRDCEVTEWGSRIVLKEGAQTVVQMDRISGYVSVRGSPAKSKAGAYAVQPYEGSCKKGQAIVPRGNVEIVRAF